MNVLFTLFALLFSGLVLATPLNKIVIFGDSLSDNGNLYEFMQHELPQSPPYYKGRFSNGLVWVEQLTRFYFPKTIQAHLLDYAVGGAGVFEGEDDMTLFTLKREIHNYLDSHDGKADENSLFIVWIGANNYLGVPDDADAAILETQQGIVHGLEQLAKAGAKHILIMNLPDLGRTPIAYEFKSEETLSYFAKQHNQLLLEATLKLQQEKPEVQWLYFDVYEGLERLFNAPEIYGFNNIKDTCYDVSLKKSSKNTLLQLLRKMKVNTHEQPCDGYVFFDPVHPTEPVHNILAEEIRGFLSEQGVEFSSELSNANLN